MKFQTELKVLGMKSSKGKMDNGMEFDSTKVYVETPLDDSKGNAKGCSVAEYTPSAVEMLYPLFTLFPELKNYQAPQHSSDCPKPQFNVFGKTITMDSHCVLAEQNRLAIASIMTVVWILVSLFILLSA